MRRAVVESVAIFVSLLIMAGGYVWFCAWLSVSP